MKWFMLLLAPLAVGALLCAMPTTSGADLYQIEKDTDLYGNLDQDDIPAGGEVDCGPTAAVNSLVYLENKYPGIYDRHLIPDIEFPPDGVRDYNELINAALLLAGANNMNTKPPGGTWDDMFIYGKWNYIEFQIPGVTTYAAQMLGTWGFPGANPPRPPDEIPPILKPLWVQDQMYPTWQFIYNELYDCEDVEILINWNGGGHFLTLTGFVWNDDGDGVIQQEEGAVMKYIDPATGDTGESGIWNVAVNSHYELMTDYETGAIVTMAVSESPIPEPATIVLVAMGLAGAIGYLRKRIR
jgi:hypothetical protein